MVRTTISIDDDVMARLDAAVFERKKNDKSVSRAALIRLGIELVLGICERNTEDIERTRDLVKGEQENV